MSQYVSGHFKLAQLQLNTLLFIDSPVLKAICQPCDQDAQISSQNSTSLTIEWTHYSFNENTSYQIDLTDPYGSGITASTSSSFGKRLMYTATELKPFTLYLVTLTAGSGNIERICHTFSTTAEGGKCPIVATWLENRLQPITHPTSVCLTSSLLAVPSRPSGLAHYGSLVVWQPPAQPNGIVTGYEIKFNDSKSGAEWTQSFGPEVNHYILSENEQADNIVIQVSTNMLLQYI